MRKRGASESADAGAGPDAEQQRIDKWLWHARFGRTRSAAQRLVRSGHVRVNRQRVESPSRLVRVGDVLTIALGRGVRVVTIRAMARRRGSADMARALYDDQLPQAAAPRPDRDNAAAQAIIAGPRPDRRERRAAVALKQRQGE